MNSIHDLGGMEGFGAVHIEEDEPVFHDAWEGWTYSIFFAALGSGVFNLDEFRYSIERMAPDEYLEASYYERWLTAIERLLIEKDVLTQAEIDDRMNALVTGTTEVPSRPDPDRFGELAAGLKETFDVERDLNEPAFGVGDRVRVRNFHPPGHTRAPRYARRAEGVIDHLWGAFVCPDSHAHGGEEADPVYNVRFPSTEIWGPDAQPDEYIHLDMWERYLEEP